MSSTLFVCSSLSGWQTSSAASYLLHSYLYLLNPLLIKSLSHSFSELPKMGMQDPPARGVSFLLPLASHCCQLFLHTCSLTATLFPSFPYFWLFSLVSPEKFLTSCNPLKTSFDKFHALAQTSATIKSHAHWDSELLQLRAIRERKLKSGVTVPLCGFGD